MFCSCSPDPFYRRNFLRVLTVSYFHFKQVIKHQTRSRVSRLARELGLPPGIVPLLELELARMQLGLVRAKFKFKIKTILFKMWGLGNIGPGGAFSRAMDSQYQGLGFESRRSSLSFNEARVTNRWRCGQNLQPPPPKKKTRFCLICANCRPCSATCPSSATAAARATRTTTTAIATRPPRPRPPPRTSTTPRGTTRRGRRVRIFKQIRRSFSSFTEEKDSMWIFCILKKLLKDICIYIFIYL